ncbi:MAG: protein-(glutamine-N5) methyltransferase, release factor-specific [Crocinitomicaceae bacterium]|nr:protein-(glutamine-N5) methyltransferase, release factor-specific [Crocinitomicaceae bacterium]|tara:strand:+ start:8321 stop:9184 length:864 start_codon:yes stop_codon:yes gene_type:complete
MKIAENTLEGVEKYIDLQLEGQYTKSEIKTVQRHLIEHYYNISSARQIVEKQHRLSESELLKIIFAMKEMKEGTPLQYVVGDAEFCGRTFKVNSNVLIPRPETEELVQWLLETNESASPSVLDIGTGSGCIPITIKSELPNSKVSACDVSMNVLKVAISNEKLNQVEIDWYILDVLSTNQPFKENQFDIIISNPPYVLKSDMDSMDNNVLEHEPHLALFVDDSDPLLFYRTIADRAKVWLKPGGDLFFEIHEKQGKQVVNLLTEMEYSSIELRKDLSGKDRMVKATL